MFLINVKNNRSDFITLIPLILFGGAGTRLWPLSCGEGLGFMVAQQIGEVSSKKPTILLEQQNLQVLEKQNKSKLFFCVSC